MRRWWFDSKINFIIKIRKIFSSILMNHLINRSADQNAIDRLHWLSSEKARRTTSRRSRLIIVFFVLYYWKCTILYLINYPSSLRIDSIQNELFFLFEFIFKSIFSQCKKKTPNTQKFEKKFCLIYKNNFFFCLYINLLLFFPLHSSHSMELINNRFFCCGREKANRMAENIGRNI